MARLAGLEPTTSAFAGLRSIQLSYKRLVPKERFELSRPCEHYALNVARLPFRHFGTFDCRALQALTVYHFPWPRSIRATGGTWTRLRTAPIGAALQIDGTIANN
jgi:hypothetical protein